LRNAENAGGAMKLEQEFRNMTIIRVFILQTLVEGGFRKKNGPKEAFGSTWILEMGEMKI